MSGRFQDAIPGLFGALFGAGVLGWGAGWTELDKLYVAVREHGAGWNSRVCAGAGDASLVNRMAL